jgi:hypothetical protein
MGSAQSGLKQVLPISKQEVLNLVKKITAAEK